MTIQDHINKIANDKGLTLKAKVERMIEYIQFISRYSKRNRELGTEAFWNWLKHTNVRDEVMVEEL